MVAAAAATRMFGGEAAPAAFGADKSGEWASVDLRDGSQQFQHQGSAALAVSSPPDAAAAAQQQPPVGSSRGFHLLRLFGRTPQDQSHE